MEFGDDKQQSEQIQNTLGLTTVTLLAVFFGLWLYNRHRHFQFFQNFGIPGPKPSIFRGNLHHINSTGTPNEVITKWKLKYGDVFGYYMGYRPFLVIYDLDILKQIFIKDFQNFVNRPVMAIKAKPLIYSLIGLRGERWKEVRRILTPAFSGFKIRQMANIINSKVDKFLNVIGKDIKNNLELDIHKKCEALTLDVIGVCGLAMKVHCQTNQNDPFLIAVSDFFRYCENPAVKAATMFPFLAKVFEFINNYMTSGKMTSMVVNSVKRVISARRLNPEQRGIDSLQLMLDASNEDESNSSKTVLSDNEIIGNALLILLAGYETSSSALAFVFYCLVTHPEVQEKLYEEVSTSIGNNSNLLFEDIQEMQYLDQVLNESLRMYPPVTGFISRESQKDMIVNGQVIPKGVIIQAPTWDIHHDPNLWSDPWKFDPDRFLPENKAHHHPVAFMPFGLGPRTCIGMRFFHLEAKITLARAIQKFKFVKCVKTEDTLCLACSGSVLLRPANGVIIQAIPR